MSTDRWGNPVSHPAPDAVAALDSAIAMLNAFRETPVDTIDVALEAHPDFALGHAFKAALFATAMDRTFETILNRHLSAAEALAATCNDRERMHIHAVRLWADGAFDQATETWGRISTLWPRDILAIQLAQQGDFFLGYSLMLRDRIARVLPHWNEATPGYGFLLGMHAFGLEEAGEYARAEDTGRRAVSLNGQDVWAVHAVAHVLEMQARADEGVAWLEQTAPDWEPDSLFSYHNWWHQSLFQLDCNNPAAAIKLFDTKISGGEFGQALELCDGSAILWRLTALGHDVGDRWTGIAEKWTPRAGHGVYAFNDMHAAMAFAATGQGTQLERLLSAAESAAAGNGTNAMMSREVGLPAIRAIDAFGRGDYAASVDMLLPVLPRANRFGGSHAQRDILSWTATEAAIRAGDRAAAEAITAERLSWKPHSPVNLAWAARASALAA